MVRIPVFKRLYNLSDAQTEYQLLDRMSYQRFCALLSATNIPDRTTIWTFENRIGEVGARGGQIIDATLVPAPRQHLSGEERAMVEEGAMPAMWGPAKRRQKDTDASWTKQHGKSHFGYKLSISVDRRYKVIPCIQIGSASTHDSQHFEAVLDPNNTSRDVYAHRAYPSWVRSEQLREA